MGGFFSKNIENRIKDSITNLRQYEDLRKAKLVQMGVFVVGIMLIFLLFIWSYTKITLRGANCSTITSNYDINYVSKLKSLDNIKNDKMDDAIDSDWPLSSASLPGKAPAVSTKDIIGRLNFSASDTNLCDFL